MVRMRSKRTHHGRKLRCNYVESELVVKADGTAVQSLKHELGLAGSSKGFKEVYQEFDMTGLVKHGQNHRVRSKLLLVARIAFEQIIRFPPNLIQNNAGSFF